VLLEQLRDDWLARVRNGPIDPVPRFAERGLVLGADTVLLSCAGNRHLQQVKEQDARLLALLSAACGKVLPRSVVDNFERAAKCWSAGDDCLAYIHLAHARLPAPRDAHASACRLLAAEIALGAGIAPQSILQALQAPHADLDPLEKFDPNQPRVPAGSGRTSGQWTDGGATGAAVSAGEPKPQVQPQGSSVVARMPTPPASFLGELGASQLAELGLYAARLLGPAAAAAVAFGLLFIPSPNDVRVEGEVPEIPGLRYSWNRDEALLDFTYEAPGGEGRSFTAQLDEDVFRDPQGRVVGRVLPDGTIAVDAAAISPDLVDEDEPRLCPAPADDRRTNDKGLAYEMHVRNIINPGNPTPPGLAYYLPNPEDSGNMVSFDECQHATGSFLAEAKDKYAGLLRFESGMQSVAEQFLDQAKRQVDAAAGNYEVRWYFSEKDTADFAQGLFREMDEGREKIKIIWEPWPGK